MNISFNNALGVHEHALELRTNRAEVLANNLANADTPGFKARDIDFQSLLSEQMQGKSNEQSLKMTTTNGKHLPVNGTDDSADLLYRTPSQPSLDGNTVDTQTEKAEFMKNTLQYQSSFQFLNSRFKGITTAIKGQ
ncbi:MAG: flagellar basal-body rod protein FlgB [Oleiphilaceae bacterium]|jgi:flagellar basal-body rod protein FlgB